MANTDVTLDNARKSVLSNQERAQGFTHKYTIKYTDIDEGSGSSDTVTVTLGATPTDFIISKAMVNVTTAMAGTGALTIQVGTDGDPNNFITATSVAAVGPIISAVGAAPVTLAGTFAAASDQLEALFTNSSSGSPSALTAGELDVYLAMHSANDVG
jgi:GTP cyclohydrolase III